MDPRIELLKQNIRDIPDFPKPGIIFKDITPLLAAPEAFRASVELFAEHYKDMGIEGIVAVESRGFLWGGPLAMALGVPMLIVRKPGKLPADTESIEYHLEYGTDKLEIHKDAITPGQKLVVLDDLLATGGTAAATAQLVKNQGGVVVECAFVINLAFLNGAEKIGTECFSLIEY